MPGIDPARIQLKCRHAAAGAALPGSTHGDARYPQPTYRVFLRAAFPASLSMAPAGCLDHGSLSPVQLWEQQTDSVLSGSASAAQLKPKGIYAARVHFGMRRLGENVV